MEFLSVALLGVVLLAGSVFAGPVKAPNADTERAAAVEAEKKGDLDAACLHYENILDSTKTDQLTRRDLHTKIAELKEKVAPNTDPSTASVWKCKAFVIRNLDFKYTDKDGKEHHVVNRFSDEEIEGLRQAMKGFQDLVWKNTWGNLRIEWDLQVLDRTITELSYDKDWGYCPWATMTMPLVADQLQYGEADSVMVYVNMYGKKGTRDDNVPCYFLADTTGIQPCTKGSTYMIFNSGGGACADPSGEVQLHEWLHAADMAMKWVHGYPADGPMDWTSDGGDDELASGCYVRKPGEKGWLPMYHHQMRDHVTRRMWRESPIFNMADNVWMNDYVRNWKVAGPFPGKGKELGGLNHPFIDETKPAFNKSIWKTISASGKYPSFAKAFGASDPDQVCYAAFAIESDKEQLALIKTQREGGCKIWQDGKLIFDSPLNRTGDADPNVIDVKLKQGKNVFLVKLNNVTCDWVFNLKVTNMFNETLSDARLTLP